MPPAIRSGTGDEAGTSAWSGTIVETDPADPRRVIAGSYVLVIPNAASLAVLVVATIPGGAGSTRGRTAIGTFGDIRVSDLGGRYRALTR